MKSYLIKDTTKAERIELIKQWVPVDEAMEDCEIDFGICTMIISMAFVKYQR